MDGIKSLKRGGSGESPARATTCLVHIPIRVSVLVLPTYAVRQDTETHLLILRLFQMFITSDWNIE